MHIFQCCNPSLRTPNIMPNRTSNVSGSSTSSTHDSSQRTNLRPLLPGPRPHPIETHAGHRTAPLARRRVSISLACESCRQRKIKVCHNQTPSLQPQSSAFLGGSIDRRLNGLHSATVLGRHVLGVEKSISIVFTGKHLRLISEKD